MSHISSPGASYTANHNRASASARPPFSPSEESTPSMFSTSTPRDSSYGSDDDLDNEPDVGNHAGAKRRKKRDEPMSPLAVVLYVVFFYTIWQILTRSDDTEILGHLPATSPLLSPYGSYDPSRSMQHMPYHLPQLPSPLPAPTEMPPSMLGRILTLVIYPFYLVAALIAIPVPFILQALYAVVAMVAIVLTPFTATARLLSRTFLFGPFAIVRSIASTLMPVYVFVGGVVGVGCILGLLAGLAGRAGVDYLLRPKHAPVATRKHRSESRRRRRHAAPSASEGRHGFAASPLHLDVPSRSRAGRPAAAPVQSGRRRHMTGSDSDLTEVPVTPIAHAQQSFALHGDSHGSGTAREPIVVGVRKRVHRL